MLIIITNMNYIFKDEHLNLDSNKSSNLQYYHWV